MATIIDSSLWIDFTRVRSPQRLKRFVAPYILAPEVVLAEPVVFEVLRYATDDEVRNLQLQFRFLPLLPTPPDLWTGAAKLGQDCRKNGMSVKALDLLIAYVALHHNAEVVTFDVDFQNIARVSKLQVRLLQRPAQ